MSRTLRSALVLAAAALCAAGGGCAHWQHPPHGCGDGVGCCAVDCGSAVADATPWRDRFVDGNAPAPTIFARPDFGDDIAHDSGTAARADSRTTAAAPSTLTLLTPVATPSHPIETAFFEPEALAPPQAPEFDPLPEPDDGKFADAEPLPLVPPEADFDMPGLPDLPDLPEPETSLPSKHASAPPVRPADELGVEDSCCELGCTACDGRPDRPCPLGAACSRCRECWVIAGIERRCLHRPEPCPPPVRMQPVLPPKFLPVPTQDILSPVRPEAPESTHSGVEVGFRPQLMFPGSD